MSMAHHEPSLDVSVVVPLLDEQDSLKELRQRIGEAMAGLSYEVIFVDDGSRDASWNIIESLHGATPEEVKGIRFARNYGKSAALQKGFEAAQGRVVFTMDADLQDDPKELPAAPAIAGRRFGFGQRMEEKAARPAQQNHPHQALQLGHPEGEWHSPARFQLRLEMLPLASGEGH